jgi:hypothetical protein
MQIAHEHYCNKCKKIYECTHSVCKFVFIRMCLSCKVIEEAENELED